MRPNVDISSQEFVARLRALRGRLDLTKPELAVRAGVSPRSVHDLESGTRKRAQEKTLRLIAHALGVSFEMLVHGEEDPAFSATSSTPTPPTPLAPPALPTAKPNHRRPIWWIVVVLLIASSAAIGFGLGGDKGMPISTNDRVPVFVTDFQNVVDPDDPSHLGTIIANLVVSDLSESRYVRVISSHGIATPQPVDNMPRLHEDSAAIRAAVQAGAKWKVCGSILQVEPTLVITSRLENISDGTVVASQEVNADENETVFDAAHRLSAAVKRDLALPSGAATEAGLPVTRVTTASIAAYRHYSEGVENLRMLYRDRARADFRRAIHDDPSFAMAYAMLAHPDIGLSSEEGDSLITLARRHSEGITRREALYIDAFDAWCHDNIPRLIVAFENMVESYPNESEAYRMLGRFYQSEQQPVKARGALEAAVQVDPFDGLSINRLAYLYASLGDTDAALRLIERYIALAPSQANPYDTRGDLLARSGRSEEAIKSYQTALQHNPQFFPSMQSLGVLMTLTGRTDEATRYFRMMLGSEDPGARCRARWLLAAVDVYQGHLNPARATLAAAIASDQLDRSEGDACFRKLCLKALIDEEQGNLGAALTDYRGGLEARRATSPNAMDDWPARYVSMLVRYDTLAARAVVDSVDALISATKSNERHAYWGGMGWIELSKGNADAACAWFERAVQVQDEIWYRYPLGLAYLRAGRAEDAIRTFDGILNWYSISRLVEPTWSVKTYYYLGRAYELAGRYTDAEKLYTEFLDVWKDADPVFPELAEARARRVHLAAGI